ncbi:MAG: hypothetical protein KGO50_08550 [Myxococcales bacterium]|nr:hypothetical protein [Myxococcales bacterium]
MNTVFPSSTVPTGRQNAPALDWNPPIAHAFTAARIGLLCGSALVVLLGIAPATDAQEGSSEPIEGSVALAAAGSGATDTPLVMTLTVPADDLAVGQPVEVVASVPIEPGENVSSFVVQANRFIEVLDVTRQTEPDGQLSNRWLVRLAVFRPGRYDSDGLSARVLRLDGSLTTAASEPFALNVVPGIVNESDPQLTPSAVPAPVVTLDWRVVYALGGLAMALIGAIIALVVNRVRKPRVEPPPPPKRPAWEVALEALQALQDADLLSVGERLQFHMRLSEILRSFVGDLLNIPAVESTTSEIETFLQRHQHEVGHQGAEIVRILEDTDLVKFARFTPPDEMSLALYSRTRAVVHDLAERAKELAARTEQSERVPDPPTPDNDDAHGGVP